jgi:hypothetical protein
METMSMERTSTPARVTVIETVTVKDPTSASRETETKPFLDALAVERNPGITVSPRTLPVAPTFTVKETTDSNTAREIVIPTSSALEVLSASRETD